MERIAVTILVITAVNKFVRGRAINNGLSLKLTTNYMKNNTDSASTGTLFEKIPQKAHDQRQAMLSKAYIPNSMELVSNIGTSKQIAKVMFPNIPPTTSNTTEKFETIIKIPISPQPFSEYKIIVATAPWKMRIRGGDMKPVVVYFVFPEDHEDPNDSNLTIPEIYFVKRGSIRDNSKRDLFRPDPLILVDNNRTVTGLKSNRVPKFVKFKNKLMNSVNINVKR